MKFVYDNALVIRNLKEEEFAAKNVEVLHPDARTLTKLEDILNSERVEYTFKYADKEAPNDRIVFKGIAWPELRFYLYLAGLMTYTK